MLGINIFTPLTYVFRKRNKNPHKKIFLSCPSGTTSGTTLKKRWEIL